MYTKLDTSLTMPRPREAARAAPPAADALPDELLCDAARPAAGPAPALWNPQAVLGWSLLFSPMLGSWLIARNWGALGEPERGRRQGAWFVGTLAIMVAMLWLPLALVGMPWLLVWYATSVKPQLDHIQQRWGQDYPRQPWAGVLAVGCGGVLVLFLFGMVLGYLGLAS